MGIELTTFETQAMNALNPLVITPALLYSISCLQLFGYLGCWKFKYGTHPVNNMSFDSPLLSPGFSHCQFPVSEIQVAFCEPLIHHLLLWPAFPSFLLQFKLQHLSSKPTPLSSSASQMHAPVQLLSAFSGALLCGQGGKSPKTVDTRVTWLITHLCVTPQILFHILEFLQPPLTPPSYSSSGVELISWLTGNLKYHTQNFLSPKQPRETILFCQVQLS